MTDKPDAVRVVFRRFLKGGDVIALMPDLPADTAGRLCVSYQHIGQHGAASYRHVIAASRPASGAEVESLRRELERIGYRVRPVRRNF